MMAPSVHCSRKAVCRSKGATRSVTVKVSGDI